VVASAAATVLRFVLLRSWIFRPGRDGAAAGIDRSDVRTTERPAALEAPRLAA
jgi:hypothetical protein